MMARKTQSPRGNHFHMHLLWVMPCICGLAALIVALAILPSETSQAEWGLPLIIGGVILVVISPLTLLAGCPHAATLIGLWLTGAVLLVVGGMLGTPIYIGAGILVAALSAFSMLMATEIKSVKADATFEGSSIMSAQAMELLSHIHENAMLSDSTKRALYREREIDLLRRTIREDISRGAYNAALILCDDMASLFGFIKEAEAFRTAILEHRHQVQEQEIEAAFAELDAFLSRQQWHEAEMQANRIRRLYPESHLLPELDLRILAARQHYQRELEQQLDIALDRQEVSEAMAILRQLDHFVSKEDAQRLQEIARAVVDKHRENLSLQFKMSVSDRQWSQALEVGEQIKLEFPNSKMANEVRAMAEVLRVRAEEGESGTNAPPPLLDLS